jgi:hypothetical protein
MLEQIKYLQGKGSFKDEMESVSIPSGVSLTSLVTMRLAGQGT